AQRFECYALQDGAYPSPSPGFDSWGLGRGMRKWQERPSIGCSSKISRRGRLAGVVPSRRRGPEAGSSGCDAQEPGWRLDPGRGEDVLVVGGERGGLDQVAGAACPFDGVESLQLAAQVAPGVAAGVLGDAG